MATDPAILKRMRAINRLNARTEHWEEQQTKLSDVMGDCPV